MNKFSITPVRRLEEVTYWVIDDYEGIHDFINTEIRKEWEADARFGDRDPRDDLWLRTLSKRKWHLEIMKTDQIRLNPTIMNYVDEVGGYNFSEQIDERSDELRDSIQDYAQVIWPVVVRGEDLMLFDGYCRYYALKKMNVRRIYVYIGKL